MLWFTRISLFYYLRQGGCAIMLSVCLSVILPVQSFCQQDYCKSNRPISLKFCIVIGPTNRNNWLTFGGDLIQDMDLGSLFHFPHRCHTADFRTFINISDTAISRFSRYLMEWIHYILGAIRQTSGSGSVWIRIFGFEFRITFGWDFGLGGGLGSLSTV